MNHLYVPVIDTSHWQFANPDGSLGVPDWKKAAAAGVKVNIIRAGRGSDSSNGTNDLGWDRSLLKNHQLSVDAGLKCAYYWRPDHLDRSPADRQADQFVDAVEMLPKMTSAPLIIDVESYTGANLGRGAEMEWFNEFRARIEDRGHHAGAYGGQWHWDNEAKLGWGDIDLIVANWPKPNGAQIVPAPNAALWGASAFGGAAAVGQDGPLLPQAFADWASWQFTSEHGTGQLFGACSKNLDCQIMKREVYERWFGRAA